MERRSEKRDVLPQASAHHARRHASSRWLGWGASAIAGVLGFTLVYGNTILAQVNSAFHPRDISGLVTTSPIPGDSPAGDNTPVNILLLGSDARTGVNGEIGGFVTGGMRNDTTIVMHISADRTRVEMVSIPRDAQVTIPQCKLSDGTIVNGREGDFNISFSNGGQQGDPAEAAACVINTVQKLTGIGIDHYAVVDFAGFIHMVDALGGVPICVPERIVSKKAKLNLYAGPQILTGKQALAFARLRTAEVGQVSGSDLQRINRQHELLHQVALTALSKNYLTDIDELTQFLRSAASSLTMDPQLADTKYLLSLAFSLRKIDPNHITFTTTPWKLTPDSLDVILLPEGEQMWEDMRNDLPLSTVGTDTPGSTWDSGRKATPDPLPTVGTGGDVNEALLSECR